jgi:choline kinase
MVGSGTEFRAVDTTGFPAMEIDSVEDLQRARVKYKAESR